jgi:hypothetical protein
LRRASRTTSSVLLGIDFGSREQRRGGEKTFSGTTCRGFGEEGSYVHDIHCFSILVDRDDGDEEKKKRCMLPDRK